MWSSPCRAGARQGEFFGSGFCIQLVIALFFETVQNFITTIFWVD
jgi:hypothetical protein